VTNKLEDRLARLKQIIAEFDAVMIAYSGGVDSTFLAKVAFDVLGDKATAVIGRSATLPASEYELARENAKRIGIRLLETDTDEMSHEAFLSNPPDRCFHCKSILFAKLTALAQEMNIPHVIEGSNFSDLADYRPGMGAVDKFGVRSPLKEAELTKDEIRELSKQSGLSTFDKPSAPCLSSRIPYGSVITPEKLSRVEQAEAYLRSLGLRELRVRDHERIARIEVPREAFDLITDPTNASRIANKFKQLGYTWVTLDIEGFRSGSLNDSLKRAAHE
jgi:uncharacterized protein